ncbi:MAG: transglutaminase domain-containing protein [Myxococcales bacterium]|nr:transglutaminase domain-containing protein [Myxococcales bacterium]
MEVLTAQRSSRVRRPPGWLLATPGVTAALLLLAGYAGNKIAYVTVRDAIFTDYSSDAGALYSEVSTLAGAGYRTDTPERRRAWRQRLDTAIGAKSLGSLEALGDDTVRAQGLALLLARHAAVPRTGCGFTDDLAEKAQALAAGGRGCCSDYTQMFVALASAVGLPARELTSNSHGFNEFYDRRLNKWVFIDAQFGFIVRGEDRVPLSALAFRNAVLRRAPHELEFFQDATLAESNRSALERNAYQGTSGLVPIADVRYYSPEGLSMLAVPWGNNVFESTDQSLRFGSLPKPAARLISHLSGVRPRYVALADAPATAPIRRRRLVAIGFYAFLAFMGGWVLLLWRAWRQRAAASLDPARPGELVAASPRLSAAPPRG